VIIKVSNRPKRMPSKMFSKTQKLSKKK